MHAITDAWAALPDVPWNDANGASFRDLGTYAHRLMAKIERNLDEGQRDPVALALLAAEAAELADALRSLASSELPVKGIYSRGWDDRGSTPGRHRRPNPFHVV